MKKIALVILFIIFLIFIPSVSAYTLVDSWSNNPISASYAWNGNSDPALITYMNGTKFMEVSKLHFYSDTVKIESDKHLVNYSGSYTNNVNGATHTADYTIDWECTLGTYDVANSICEADVYFSNWGAHGSSLTANAKGTFQLTGLYGALGNPAYAGRIYNGQIDSLWNASTNPYKAVFSVSGGTSLIAGDYEIYTGSSVAIPETSFVCVPTSQYPDYDVVCTDTSTNVPTDWLWTIDVDAWGVENWQTHTGQNFTWQSHYPGLYSVNLRANNSAGSDWYNLTDYVSIAVNATPSTCYGPIVPGYIRTMVGCVDSQTGGWVHECAINLLDKEGSAWSNNSAALGTHCIDTLPMHHIDAYGAATGYTSTYRTDLPASDAVLYELLMIPGYVPPAADGKVWLYVLVNDLTTGQPVTGATVTISGSGQVTQVGVTDTTGSIHKQWANVSTAYVSVSKTGYNTATKTVITTASGPDTIRVELSKGTVNPTATQTTGPGGTIPPTIGPYGTPGPGGTYAPGYTNNQGQKMMDFLATNGLSLVELCFFVTVCALLGVKFGK